MIFNWHKKTPLPSIDISLSLDGGWYGTLEEREKLLQFYRDHPGDLNYNQWLILASLREDNRRGDYPPAE